MLLVALLAMAAAAPELGTLDFSLGGGEASSASSPAVTSEPVWATDPLAAPVEHLSR